MSRVVTSRPLRPGTPQRSPVATGAIVLVVWAVILGAVVGLGWLITHPWQGPVDSFDNDLARWFADERTDSLSSAADVGTWFGDTPVAMGVAAVAALGFSLWRRSFLPALFVALVTVGIGGFYSVATHVDPRQRPPVKILDPGLVPDHSFPSGHVGTATAVYGGIVVLTWVYARSARRWVWLLLALPAMVLMARLYQGAHHLTDVLTSLVYATVWLLVLARLLLSQPMSQPMSQPRAQPMSRPRGEDRSLTS